MKNNTISQLRSNIKKNTSSEKVALIKFSKNAIPTSSQLSVESTNQGALHDARCAGPHKIVMGVSLLVVALEYQVVKNRLGTVTNGRDCVSSFDSIDLGLSWTGS